MTSQDLLQLSIIGVAALIIYTGDRILRRLNSDVHRPIFESEAGHFSMWVETDEVFGEEFEIGYIDGWVAGHTFQVAGPASTEPDLEVNRSSVEFHALKDALSSTNVIGWSKLSQRREGGKYMEVHISLTPDLAKNLLDEIRHNPKISINIQGHRSKDKEDRYKITHFSCRSRLD